MKLKSSIIAMLALSSISFAGGDIGGVTTFENDDYVAAEAAAEVYAAEPVMEESMGDSISMEDSMSMGDATIVEEEPMMMESTSYEAPAETYEAPAETYEAPAETYEAPAETYEETETTYEAPAQSYEETTTTYEAPAQSYEETTTTYEAPAQSYEETTTTYEAPAAAVTTTTTTVAPVQTTTTTTNVAPVAAIKKDVTPTPVPPVMTKSAVPGNFYVGGALATMAARSNCDGDRVNLFSNEDGQDRQTGLTGIIGYDFMNYLGAELRASLAVAGEEDGNEKMQQYGIYLKPNYDVTDAINLYGLLGYSSVNMSDCFLLPNADPDNTNSGFSYGAGLDYGVTENISVFTDIVNYLRDDDKDSTWGTNIGLKYNF